MPGYKYGGAQPYTPPKPKPPAAPKRTRSPHPSPCGTPSAYTRHRQRGEPIDEPCRQANAAACKARRERRKAAA